MPQGHQSLTSSKATTLQDLPVQVTRFHDGEISNFWPYKDTRHSEFWNLTLPTHLQYFNQTAYTPALSARECHLPLFNYPQVRNEWTDTVWQSPQYCSTKLTPRAPWCIKSPHESTVIIQRKGKLQHAEPPNWIKTGGERFTHKKDQVLPRTPLSHSRQIH